MQFKMIFISLVAATTTIVVHAMEITTIHDAVIKGNIEEVRRFINIDPTLVNQPDAVGDTPLHIAVERNDATLVGCLIERGADVNRENNNGKTPLMTAALWHLKINRTEFNNRDVTILLLKNGAIIDQKDKSALSHVKLLVEVRTTSRELSISQKNAFIEGKAFYDLLKEWLAEEQTYAYLAKEAYAEPFIRALEQTVPCVILQTNTYFKNS